MPTGAAVTSFRATRSPLSRLLRWARYGVAGAVVLGCLAMLGVRFVALPRLESQREDVAALLSRELGHPVEIDGIATGWDGWNPQIAVRGLRVRDRARTAAQPLIDLPEVSGVVSWTSLLAGEVRMKSLLIDRPRLSIRRDVSGRIHVAGIEIDPEAAETDPRFTEWLLNQREIVVNDALVTWNDDRRNAPQLLLDRVDLRLESGFGRHRFGLRGTPPAEIAAPIDVRGDFASLRDGGWKQANGRMYVRLDFADMAAWSEWLPLPVPVHNGEGALRLWFDIEDGVPGRVVADVELANVRARLAESLPPLDLAHLAGRLTFERSGKRYAFNARELTFVAPSGVRVVPADVALHYELTDADETREGRLTVSHLELGPLSSLAPFLPLPDALRSDITRHAPRGTLTGASYEWEGPLAKPAAFRSKGAFHDLGIRADEWLPGFARLSGAFDASERRGTLKVSSREVSLDMPRVFQDTLALDTLSGRVAWERGAGGVEVRFDDVEFANADATGTAKGVWSSRPKGPGAVDATARVSRADLRGLHRYMPRTLSPLTRAWIRESLSAGTVDGADLTLKGDLDRFPFADGRSGTFVVAARVRDVSLDYARGWPALADVDADVRFERQGMSVSASRGRVLGASIAHTKATIPDLALESPLLVVEGEATGPTAEFLRFVEASPVAAWIDRATDGMQASGNARLGLRFEMHPGVPGDVARVKGELQVADNQLRVPGLSALSRVNGRFAFTEREFTGRDVAFEGYGGTGRITLASRDGTMKATGSGTANVATLRSEVGALPMERISGNADWRLELETRAGATRWAVDSNLRGTTVDLPKPLGKAAAETTNFRLERRPATAGAGRETIVAQYGDGLRVVAERGGAGREPAVDRALVLLGKAAARPAEPDRAGVAIRGDIAKLDVDAWLGVMRAEERRAGARTAPATGLAAVDVEAGEVLVFGRRFEQAKVSARRGADGWQATVDSKPLQGSVTWSPAGEQHASGRVVARLSRLNLGAAQEVAEQASGSPPGAARPGGRADPWPEVEVTAERYFGRAGDIGRMELSARPEAGDWRISRFTLGNESGRIDADGWWRTGGASPQTKLDVAVDVKDAAAFLARFGLPGDVKAAPTRIEGQLAWPGSPGDFTYQVLSGTLRVDVGAGQFTKIEPGVGRLLGVLSLQSLPRRISLDFRDVFSDGFAFDSIRGMVRIGAGVMHTENLLVAGPSAKIGFSGDVDLARETQALTVRVQPSLSTTVSAGAGAAAVVLLAANPLVGAAVGAGALIAQKIMQDPIEQLFSYEYSVKGSWSEPLVERVAGRALTAGQPAATAAGTR